ncbi:MAG: RagB/SusD family nutrient uptake outer membrane protein [bacterium]
MNKVKIISNTRVAARLAACSLLIAVVAFIGCKGTNIADPNAPSLESATIQTLVTGAEAGMRTDLDVYLQVLLTIGREGYFFEGADPRFTGELLFGPIDAGGFLTTRPWSGRYAVVFNCNELLKRAADLPDAERASVEGFAKTIRAYQLLLNLNYLDDSGIRLNFDGDITKPFATKEEAFAFIDNDLDEAFAALKSAGSSFPFQLSAGFAGFDTPAGFAQFNRALKARVSVYQMKFNEALSALQDSFIDPNGDFLLGVYHVYSTAVGDLLNPVFEVPTSPGLKLHVHLSFAADAEPGDLRFSSKTFKRPEVDVFDDLPSDLAAILTFGESPGSSNRFPIIRNEELILLRAESNVGLGNFAAAEADLNIVRAKAGLPPLTGTDANNGLDRVLKEKRYSLFMEGHRWIDMRRYNKLDELPIDRPDRGDKVIRKMAVPETEVPG